MGTTEVDELTGQYEQALIAISLGVTGARQVAREALAGRAQVPTALPWHLTAGAVAYLRSRDTGLDAVQRHNADELQAYIRDYLDDFGMTLVDETVAFHGLVFLALFARCAQNGRDLGAFTEDETLSMLALMRLIGAAVVQHAPVEVGR